MKNIIEDIKKSTYYQHKSLTSSLELCQILPEDKKFILLQNRINTKTILTHLKRLENRFIFKKQRKEDN